MCGLEKAGFALVVAKLGGNDDSHSHYVLSAEA